MIKKWCDNCNKEIIDRDFSFEAMVREIKQTLLSGSPKPQLLEKIIHLDKKCYEDKKFK